MLAAPEGCVEILAGTWVPKRGKPLAMAYAGHRQSDPRTGARERRLRLLADVAIRLGGICSSRINGAWVIGADADVGCAFSGQRRWRPVTHSSGSRARETGPLFNHSRSCA